MLDLYGYLAGLLGVLVPYHLGLFLKMAVTDVAIRTSCDCGLSVMVLQRCLRFLWMQREKFQSVFQLQQLPLEKQSSQNRDQTSQFQPIQHQRTVDRQILNQWTIEIHCSQPIRTSVDILFVNVRLEIILNPE